MQPHKLAVNGKKVKLDSFEIEGVHNYSLQYDPVKGYKLSLELSVDNNIEFNAKSLGGPVKRKNSLRALMNAYRVTQEDIAQLLGKSAVYISERMTGKRPWDLDDIYIIRAFFNSLAGEGEPEVIPLSEIAEFFPPRRIFAVNRKGQVTSA